MLLEFWPYVYVVAVPAVDDDVTFRDAERQNWRSGGRSRMLFGLVAIKELLKVGYEPLFVK